MLRVKFERLRRNWSQTVLAFRTRMSAAEISRIETGRTKPYPGQMKRISRVLGLAAASLLENVVEGSPVRAVSLHTRRNGRSLKRAGPRTGGEDSAAPFSDERRASRAVESPPQPTGRARRRQLNQ